MLLAHPSAEDEIRVVSDASDFAMGAVLEQFTKGSWSPLAFFSQKFTSAQKKYSAYDRELTAAYEAIKYFKYFLEGREFKLLTDHKPLIYAFMQKSEKASPRQSRQLSFIGQYTTCIQYVSGTENVVADPLSRIDEIRLPTEFSLIELAEQQETDEDLKEFRSTPDFNSRFKRFVFGSDRVSLYCESSSDDLRPFIPKFLRQKIFELFHNPAYR